MNKRKEREKSISSSASQSKKQKVSESNFEISEEDASPQHAASSTTFPTTPATPSQDETQQGEEEEESKGTIQKSQLINIRELKQTYERLFREEKLALELENQALEDKDDENLAKLYDENYDKSLLDASDLMLEDPFELIEEAIRKQLLETQQYDKDYTNPAELAQETKISLDSIPTYESIVAKQKTDLLSLTEKGIEENGIMLPRKEMNYITTHMMSSTLLKNGNTFKPIPEMEFLLRVALYHPERNIKTQEYEVLASQKLTDLRDVMYCLSDHIIDGPNMKSGYFFIENTFYNDMRQSTNIDYSSKIIEWVKEEDRFKQQGLSLYSSARMEDTTFYDLSIRIGERYVYCHQGNCKHYIIFTELRLLTDEDDPNMNVYPKRVFQSKVRRRKCSICEIYPAKYVTYDDKFSAEDPTFYCDNCYFQFHYSAPEMEVMVSSNTAATTTTTDSVNTVNTTTTHPQKETAMEDDASMQDVQQSTTIATNNTTATAQQTRPVAVGKLLYSDFQVYRYYHE